MNRDQRLNDEGYKDLTAFIAIYRGGINMNWKNGDIVSYDAPDGRRLTRVLIKCHYSYATALLLFDEEQRENEYPIKAAYLMHADLGKLTYIRERLLDDAELVRTMDDDEYDELISAIGSALGFFCTEEHDDDEEEPGEETDDLYEEIEGLKKQLKEAQDLGRIKQITDYLADAQNGDTEKRITRLEAERDTYKELYMNLLGRMVKSA